MTTPTKTEGRRLTGHLGPIGIVFMVVAAAAPLTVIGGNMPLGHGPRQRCRRTGRIRDRRSGAARLQHRVRHDDAARPRGRRVLLLRDGRSRPTDGQGHRRRRADRLHRHPDRHLRLHRLGHLRHRRALRRTRDSMARILVRRPGDRRRARLPAHRTERQGARGGAGPRNRHRRGARHRDGRQSRPGWCHLRLVRPRRVHPRHHRHRHPVRAHRFHRVRGHRGVPRRGTRPGAHDPARHVCRGDHHRRVLRDHRVGVRGCHRPRSGDRRRTTDPRR